MPTAAMVPQVTELEEHASVTWIHAELAATEQVAPQTTAEFSRRARNIIAATLEAIS